MTLKQIIRQVRKAIVTPKYDDDQVNQFLNDGIDEMNRWCFVSGCNKKFKNHRGVMIHIAKKHGMTKKKLVEGSAKYYENPN